MLKRLKPPSPAMLVACLSLFVALGGISYAAVKIDGKNIKKGTVTAKQLKNNAVTTQKLKNGAVSGAKIKNRAITGAKINAATLGKVPTAQLADRALTADSASRADNVRGSTGSLALGEEKTIASHGPLSVIATCGDSNGTPASVELRFYIASTENGSWFASWTDGSFDFGPATPQTDRELNDAGWIQATAGNPFGFDQPADAGVIATAPSGASIYALPGGIVQWDVGCKYTVTTQITS